MSSTWELRNDVREMLEFDRKEHEQYQRPFRKHELNRAYYALTMDKIDGSRSIGYVRYYLLDTMSGDGRSALECDSPLRKDEIETLKTDLEEAAE